MVALFSAAGLPKPPKDVRTMSIIRQREPRKENAIGLPPGRGREDVNNEAEYRVKHFPGTPQTKTR